MSILQQAIFQDLRQRHREAVESFDPQTPDDAWRVRSEHRRKLAKLEDERGRRLSYFRLVDEDHRSFSREQEVEKVDEQMRRVKRRMAGRRQVAEEIARGGYEFGVVDLTMGD